MTVKPFKALRPSPKFVNIVQSLPYDVVTREDIIRETENNPYSFLNVTRADVFFPKNDSYQPAVYSKARENLLKMLDDGVLKAEDQPVFFLYAQTWKRKTQTGLFSLVSCEEYENNLIRKHELTREVKERDRTSHIQTVRADTGVVFLAFQEKTQEFQLLKEEITNNEPLYEFEDENQALHRLYPVREQRMIENYIRYFKEIEAFYIADGHHRAASAVNVWKEKNSNEQGPEDFFLSVLFPEQELNILPYQRGIFSLNGTNEKQLIEKISAHFEISPSDTLHPGQKGEIIMILPEKLYRLTPKKEIIPEDDPANSLDVALLQKYLFSPLFGIDNPRTSENIDFIGGIKGTDFLKKQVDQGIYACAFSMFPVSMQDIIEVTEHNQLMPPKSTWFEPKLRDGLVVYSFDHL